MKLSEEQLASQKAKEAARKMKSRRKVAEKLSEAEIAERKTKESERTRGWKKRRREKVKAMLAECQRLLEDD